MADMTRLGTRFVWYSITIAVLHFIGETLFFIQFGQYLPMLIVDYIAISLLLLGCAGFVRWGWGPGLLCGGWGFEFCLNYRTFFIRMESIQAGAATDVTLYTAYVLGSILSLSALAFVVSAYICIQDARQHAGR